jgi:5-methyltetrahydropteroyltriglutamate--homocysteine methyltransferase
VAEALVPVVSAELRALVDAGCREVCVDEPSMSCYAHREDPARLVDLFNRTASAIVGRTRLSTHLCFGNYKGRAVAPRRYAPLFPAFLGLKVDEVHLEMASREFAEIERLKDVAAVADVAVGIVDVKSYWVEPAEEIAARVRACLRFAPAERLAFAPDCGLSQTARWAARAKLVNLVAGVAAVRRELRS